MLESINSEFKSIILGQNVTEKPIFRILDLLCVDEGPVKPIFDKNTEKLLDIESLDYLKSKYKIPTEDSSKNTKRKLYPLSCQYVDNKDRRILYLSPLIDTTKATKGNEMAKWFSQKCFVVNNNLVSPTKVICRELQYESLEIHFDAIYVSPIFYKAKQTITINNPKIIFKLYFKELYKIDLPFEYVKSLTIYAKCPLIKLTIRTKIADEICKLYQKYDVNKNDIFKASPKKANTLKDVMLVFTSNPLSKDYYNQLVRIFGDKIITWNESESETQEILENVLHKSSNKLEILSSNNWPLIFKPEDKEKINPCKRNVSLVSSSNIPLPPPSVTPISLDKIPPPPPLSLTGVNKAQFSPNIARKDQKIRSERTNLIAIKPFIPLISTPNVTKVQQPITPMTTPKSSRKQNKQPSSISKVTKIQPLSSSTPHHTPQNISQPHAPTPPQNITQIPPPPPPPQLSSFPQNLVNYTVTTSNPIVTFDSRSNIFNRISTDTQTYQISNINFAAINQFIANGGRVNQPMMNQPMMNQPMMNQPMMNQPMINQPLMNQPVLNQPMINLPLILNVEGTNTINNAAPPKPPVPSTNLMYVSARNITNIFETFHYNPSPESDVLIHGSDLLCLNFGQYLNDNIINFYLNFIRYEIMSEDQRQRTHLFNVFFNTKLQGGTPGDSAEVRHARVAKWTKKVDIFDKDFIIIPICENQHWFLAIVCFPWMAGMISYDHLLGNNEQAINDIPINETKFAKIDRVKRVQRLREEYKVEPSPCILLFDSLQFISRAPSVKLIREYLKSEWDSKRSATDGSLVFDKNTVRGFNPQVPQQTNNIDCGIFILHYVEQFFLNPLPEFTKEYFQSSLLTWFENETVSKKRAMIQRMVLAKADAYKALCETTSSIGSENSVTNVQQNIDDSGSDILIL